MNVVVSTNSINYDEGWVKYPTLEGAYNSVGNIGVLVYNSSDEDNDLKISYLSKLKEKVEKMIYVCSEDKTDLAVKMIIQGLEGMYFDDEFFLESSHELNILVSSLEEVQLSVLSGVGVVSDFFNKYLNEGSSGFNTNYLMVVKDAVREMLTDYNTKSLEIIQMSETATEIFSNTSTLLSSIRRESDSLKKELEKLKNNTSNISFGTSSRGNIMFFPRVNYMKEKSIIRIKEIGGFKFLISFCLGLRLYLENIENVRPKLIVIDSVGDISEEIYKDFKWVKSSTKNSRVNYYHNIVFTNYPTKDVLDTLLNDDNFDTFIVVDRTKSDREHILNCKGSSIKYAIGGKGVVDRFKLPLKDCFSSIIEVGGNMFTLPAFTEYPKDKFKRERLYLSEVSDYYSKLISDLRRR